MIRAWWSGFYESWRAGNTDVETAKWRRARARVILNQWKAGQ